MGSIGKETRNRTIRRVINELGRPWIEATESFQKSQVRTTSERPLADDPGRANTSASNRPGENADLDYWSVPCLRKLSNDPMSPRFDSAAEEGSGELSGFPTADMGPAPEAGAGIATPWLSPELGLCELGMTPGSEGAGVADCAGLDLALMS